MGKSKKKNPRRIPLDKSTFDLEAIRSEAAEMGLTHAWLLVANALTELEYASPDQISTLADTVNRTEVKRSDYALAERITGLEVPSYMIDVRNINSPVDLDRCKRRIADIGLKAGLRTLCVGLEQHFSRGQLERLFLNIRLTLAEIDAGCNTYREIEDGLVRRNIVLDKDTVSTASGC